MKTRVLGLLLLLLPITASAQFAYDYTSGPISSVTDNSGGTAPPLGTDITGVITLAQPLPENGTVNVTPLSLNFQSVNSLHLVPPLPDDRIGFIFTTANDVITAFSFKYENVEGSTQLLDADSASNTLTYAQGFQGPVPNGYSLLASAGGWTPEHLGHGVPEINLAGAGSALTLLAGMLAVLRGRRRPS